MMSLLYMPFMHILLICPSYCFFSCVKTSTDRYASSEAGDEIYQGRQEAGVDLQEAPGQPGQEDLTASYPL